MRLEAPGCCLRRYGPIEVYHAEWCKVLPHVVWVDDDSAQWAEHSVPLRFTLDGPELAVHQAKRILILLDRRLVVINPIADEDQAPADTVVRIDQPECTT